MAGCAHRLHMPASAHSRLLHLSLSELGKHVSIQGNIRVMHPDNGMMYSKKPPALRDIFNYYMHSTPACSTHSTPAYSTRVHPCLQCRLCTATQFPANAMKYSTTSRCSPRTRFRTLIIASCFRTRGIQLLLFRLGCCSV